MCLLRDVVFAFHAGVLVHADAQRGAEADEVDEAGEAAPAFIVADGLQGDVQARGSGELKNILVERVDSIEPTLAHVIPEMSSNAVVVMTTLAYLFALDWRMALASLITLPLGMVFFMLMMLGYEKTTPAPWRPPTPSTTRRWSTSAV